MIARRITSITILALGLMLATTVPALAQTMPCGTSTTPGAVCTSDQVGPFMQGVSVGCGNLGNCELKDIEQVLYNISDWILGIVGSLVLLFYIWGGLQFLASGSNATSVKAGKESIKKATLGLVIVFIAFIAIHTLKDVLLGSAGGTGGTFIQCTGPGTSGKTCAARKVCDQAGTACVDACEYKYPNNARRCIPKAAATGSCETNLCSDPSADIQCCVF